MLSKTITGKI